MTFFSKDLHEKANRPSPYVKTEEFAGKKWQIKKVEVVKSGNSKYGANEKDALFLNKTLELGETIRYSFIDEAGAERIYESKGAAFFIAFKEAEKEGVDTDTWVTINGEGKGEERRYSVEKA